MGGDCQNNSIIEIGQNTDKSPGDLRRLAVAQTPVKTLKKLYNNNTNAQTRICPKE